MWPAPDCHQNRRPENNGTAPTAPYGCKANRPVRTRRSTRYSKTMIQGKPTDPLGGTSETRASTDRSSSDPRPETTTSSPRSAGGSGGGVRLTARGTPVREPGRFRCRGPRSLCITTSMPPWLPFHQREGAQSCSVLGAPSLVPPPALPAENTLRRSTGLAPGFRVKGPAGGDSSRVVSGDGSAEQTATLHLPRPLPGLLRAAPAAAPALTRGPQAHVPSHRLRTAGSLPGLQHRGGSAGWNRPDEATSNPDARDARVTNHPSQEDPCRPA